MQLEDAIDLVWLPNWASKVRVGLIDPILKSREMTSFDGNIIYFIDRFMHEKRNTLSAYDSSEGTLFLLFMTVLLSDADAPSIFAVDNVDSALNPSLTRRLLETIIRVIKRKEESKSRRGPTQIFLTSHNPTALDAFDLFDDSQRVFVVRRNENGHSVVTRLRPKEGWTRENWEEVYQGRKLSQIWIDGDIRGALGEI